MDIDLLILDFDGVLTDNRVYVMQDGQEAVACHRGDGWGINLLRNAGELSSNLVFSQLNQAAT